MLAAIVLGFWLLMMLNVKSWADPRTFRGGANMRGASASAGR
jgi:hypothetical protein